MAAYFVSLRTYWVVFLMTYFVLHFSTLHTAVRDSSPLNSFSSSVSHSSFILRNLPRRNSNLAFTWSFITVMLVPIVTFLLGSNLHCYRKLLVPHILYVLWYPTYYFSLTTQIINFV